MSPPHLALVTVNVFPRLPVVTDFPALSGAYVFPALVNAGISSTGGHVFSRAYRPL